MIKPVNGRIVLKRIEEDNPFGFTIPDNPDDIRAVVMSTENLSQFEIGEVVLTGKYTGTYVTLEDKKYIVMKEEDILGVLE
jgi:chaperonin GroES